MKKLFLLLSALMVSLALFACGDDPSNNDGTDIPVESPEEETFTVTWYDSDGALITKETLEKGTVPARTYTVTDTAEWDYTFVGWSTTKGGNALASLPSVSADVSYYAKVNKVKQRYTVSFDVGAATAIPSQTVEYGALATQPSAPTLGGYSFVGWFTDSNRTVAVDFTKPITATTVFYASFKALPSVKETFTVTWYDSDGALITKETLEKGTVPARTYTVTDTAEWDYTFVGWSTTKGGNALASLPSVSADVSYYAKVNKVKQRYTVSFDVGAATAIPSQTVEYGALATQPSAPTLGGHSFVGWFTDSNCTVAADFTKPITVTTVFYAAFNMKIDLVSVLESLLSGYKMNPYSKIPESMRPDYAGNLVDPDDIISDYSGFVPVSNIKTNGFGEQWNMVIENLEQSRLFFNALSVVEGLTSVSVTEFNNYLDKNASDTAHHSFASGIYNVTIYFDGSVLYYAIDYTASIGKFGEQSVQICMQMDIDTLEKTVRVQIGDANALKYTITDSGYEFAIKYLGVRRAYFSLSEDSEGNVTGHIYEYLSYNEAELKSSAADFYIKSDGYLTAVGNKTDDLVGFTGYISEVYDISDGSLVGYEMKETGDLMSSISYDRLWFDLCKISGINSIKVVEADGEDPVFYINGSRVAFETKKVGGFSLLTASQRYYIKMKNRYFYTYDAENDEYVKIEASVPMLMVLEDYYSTLSEDIESKNNVTVTSTVSAADLERIKSDYAAYIDVFIEKQGPRKP